MNELLNRELAEFLSESPTAFHAVSNIRTVLECRRMCYDSQASRTITGSVVVARPSHEDKDSRRQGQTPST